MSKNIDFSLNVNYLPSSFTYPSLGSNYTPNLIIDSRIYRFEKYNIKDEIQDTLHKYKKAISDYYSSKNIIEKSGTLEYTVSNNNTSFNVYLNDLNSATNISVTLVSAIALTTNSSGETKGYSIPSSEFIQPKFSFDDTTGYLSIDFGDDNI